MTQKELYQKYLSDLKSLQDSCKHEKVSDWMMIDDSCGPGRWYRDGRFCEVCNKLMEDRNPSEILKEFIKRDMPTIWKHD